MRVTVIGLPGSGKSTVARMISEKLGIPHIHIDRFWFEAGGGKGSHDTPNIEEVRAHVRAKTLEAIVAESWVSDGFYRRVQDDVAARANIILFLDVPLWRRLLNHAIRTFRRHERHAEVSFWDDLIFFSEIIRRTFTNGPKLRQFVAEYADKVVVLKSRASIVSYLGRLTLLEQ